MKRIRVFGLLLGAFFMASCSMLKESSSTTMEVQSSLNSKTEADLEVSPQKISYTYIPNKRDRKAGLSHVLSNATAAALKENGNADVLVERQYDALIKYKFFGLVRKMKSVTVTGYPATYKNFRQAETSK